jgi:hypothetical protein
MAEWRRNPQALTAGAWAWGCSGPFLGLKAYHGGFLGPCDKPPFVWTWFNGRLCLAKMHDIEAQ